MGIKQDLTNMDFGELHVIKYADNGKWLCKCSCGKLKEYRTYTLTHGDAKTCGHGRNKPLGEDLSGKQFGNWKVLRYVGNSSYECECQCINHTIKNIRGIELKNGSSKSCGCINREDLYNRVIGDVTVVGYNKENYKWICKCNKCGETLEKTKYELINRNNNKCTKINKYKDITNQRFGEWTVIRHIKNSVWECMCSCENHTIRYIDKYDLEHGYTTNCGCKRHKELTGKIFNRLTVRKYLGNMLWECECSCKNHTIVNVLTCNLLNGSTQSCGCLKNESRNSKEEYIKAISDYINEHGDKPYLQDISNILKIHSANARHNLIKYGLLDQLNKSFGSIYERDIYNYIKELIPSEDIVLHNRDIIKPQELDIYIPNKKLAIEFNGDYWHSDNKVSSTYHQNKTIECAKHGVHLIHIFEYEWTDESLQDKIKQLIKSKLVSPDKILYARNTNLKLVDDIESKEFLEKYHLQGYAQANINIGLYNNNELVSLLTFGPPRFNNNYQYEIVRYCNKFDIGVVGGIEKLFKYFVSNYNPKSIITYSDISKFTGNIYTKLGFKPINPNPLTEPSYIWVNDITHIILQRYQTQKHKLLELGLGTIEQTENEIMVNNGFMKLYTCGNIRMEYIAS